MARTKEILTAAGTLACALGIGFVMQSGASNQAELTPIQQNATKTPVAKPVKASQPEDGTRKVEPVAAQSVTSATNVDISIEAEEEAPVISQASILPAPQPRAPAPAVPKPACDISANAIGTEDGLVTLSLSAPCLPNERVKIHHSGMQFTEATDDGGQIELSVPALSANAVFLFEFVGGQIATAQTAVDSLHGIRRVALQWQGDAGFELHAREFGAGYDENGHVWRQTLAEGHDSLGYMTQLGDPLVDQAYVAEIYSFPTSADGATGEIDLTVEAVVTARNCGLEISAQSIALGLNGSLETQDLTMNVPDCDAIGDYLVLNNALESMKIAAR